MYRALKLSLLLTILLCTCVRAQSDGCTGETFVHLLSDEGLEDVRATCLIPYPGAGDDLLLGGTVGGDIFLTRISRTGERRWRRVISTPSLSTELSTLSEVVVDEEGMIAGVGSTFNANNLQRAYLFRYDPLGDQVIYLRQPPFSSEGTGISLGQDGEYLVSGSKKGEPTPIFNSGYLARFSRATGALVDEGTSLDFLGDEGILNLVRQPDGTAFLGGNVSATGGAGDTRASITHLDAEGKHVWTRIGPASANVNARLFTFDIEVVGQTVYVLSWGNIGNITGSVNTAMILSAFDLNGEHQWTRRYDLAQFEGEEAVELVQHDGGLLAYGFGLIGRRAPYLIHLSLAGEVNWARSYDLPGSAVVYFRCNQQLLTDDSGIFTLATYAFAGARPREGALLRLDNEGFSDNECLVINEADIVVTNIGSNWALVELTPSPQPLAWTEENASPLPSQLTVFDDCDIPCDDCFERVFTRAAICQGSSIILGGLPQTSSGIYADTVPGLMAGCDSILLTELVVSNGPEAAFSINRSCGFSTVDVQLSVDGGERPYAYNWSVAGAAGPRVSLPSGIYQVTVDDALGCSPKALEITIENITSGGLNFRTDAPFCPGENTGVIRLEPAGTGSIRLLTETGFIPDRIDSLAPGNYGVILRDSTGCEAFRQVYIPEARPAEIEINSPAVVRLGDEVSLYGSARFGSLFNDYSWSAEDSLGCSNCPIARYRPSASGMVFVEAVSERGCPVSDSLFIRVTKGAPRVYVPTGFSPNGDDLNDQWVPGLGPEVDRVSQVEVFDRWGGLVWIYGGDGVWWDGGASAAGTYVFRMSVVLIDGREEVFSGQVVLVR
jgi:gliding motility-associated-like protein